MILFRKKSKLSFEMVEQTDSRHKIRDWFSKWDRTIAATTGIVIFCAILIVVILNVKVLDNDNDGEDLYIEMFGLFGHTTIRPHPFDWGKTASGCSSDSDTITCKEVAVGDLCAGINQALEQSERISNLQLVDISNTDNEIEEGWLNCVKDNSFTQLTITSFQLTTIGKKAFSGPPFTTLQVMYLNTSISYFQREMFEELQAQRLQITCTVSAKFENNVFGPVQNLRILQLSGCLTQTENNIILPNITGAEELNNLKELDIRYNSLRKLTANSFVSTPFLKNLYIGSSTLMEIEAGTFDDLLLSQLDLSNNELKTLPEGIFRDVKSGIALEGNTLTCDCNLVWLQNLLKNQPQLFTLPTFNCYSEQGGSVPYTNSTIFCDNDTVPTDTTTTELTTVPTPDTEFRKITCFPIVYAKKFDPLLEIASLEVRNNTVRILFHDTNIINITGVDSEHNNLLWYNSDDHSEAYCLKNITDSVMLTPPVSVDTFYIFCLITSESELLSPFDCAPFRILPETQEDITTWISKDQMIPIVAGACLSLVLVALLTGFIVFYCIRQHPSLIKGNKRVIIVESEAADAIVMPATCYNEFSYRDYRPPSFSSYTNGYLTPRRDVRPRTNLKTISEQTDVKPSSSSREKNHYRRKSKIEHLTQYYDGHVYEAPPPLPPNHPSEKKFKEKRSYSKV